MKHIVMSWLFCFSLGLLVMWCWMAVRVAEKKEFINMLEDKMILAERMGLVNWDKIP